MFIERESRCTRHVLKFVKWDVFHNSQFVFGSVVLAQGDKGVPIGGFLSAQWCVLWGVFCGSLLFDDVVEDKRRGGTDSFSEISNVVEKKWNPPLSPLMFARRGVFRSRPNRILRD